MKIYSALIKNNIILSNFNGYRTLKLQKKTQCTLFWMSEL